MLPSNNFISSIKIKKEIPDTDDDYDNLMSSSTSANNQTNYPKHIKLESASIYSPNNNTNEMYSETFFSATSNVKYSSRINENELSSTIIKQESIDIKTEIYSESDSTTIKPDFETSLISVKDESYGNLADFENYCFDEHSTESKKSHCDLCGKGFSTQQTMKRHRKEVHATIKKHICHICKKSFGSKYTLKRHENAVHLKIREWKCTFCEKVFSLKAQLKSHERTVHLKNGNWKCTHCDKSFNFKEHLNCHERTVHLKFRDWKCVHCDKSYSTKQSLSLHERVVHMKIRDWKCTYCEKSFKYKYNLKRHECIAHLEI